MEKIGILGGTFDPPHIGHLLMAEEARLKVKLDEVWWMPNRIPPHKEKDSRTTIQDRLHMVKKMTLNHPSFKLCDIELKRKGPSYTTDTMEDLTRRYPDKKFYFIIGEDSLESLPNWHRVDKLSKLVFFVVIRRPGYSVNNSDINSKFNITLIDGPTIDVSSTGIRSMIKGDTFNQFLVLKDVYEIIKENHLYE